MGNGRMHNFLSLLSYFLSSAPDLTPIIPVIAFFQLVVLQEPIPNLGEILGGVILVVLDSTFFIRGLVMGLFNILRKHGPCFRGY
jgi:hypothetical protein